MLIYLLGGLVLLGVVWYGAYDVIDRWVKRSRRRQAERSTHASEN